jgi:asparagine synthase (glutamine-hydrolysing)
MCGIAGAIWTDPQRAVSREVLERMTDVLAHRGPDDAGFYESIYRLRPPYEPQPGIALGHRRLAVIDIEGGNQPMSNEEGTIWVVFNGEIYNFAALRNRLEGSGHKFRTRCDTETIVHLYEDEGLDCVTHLNGMFAMAIWDAGRRRLVLARDRLGQKPLVYRHDAGRLLFASQLKSLLEVPDVPRELDPSSLDEYLTYQYVPHPNTIFRGIGKLPPGHCAVYQDDEFEVQAYWRPDFSREVAVREAQYAEQLRDLLTDAVQSRLVSDVPLGAFLSGGIDSSLVVALMRQAGGPPVKTFSIGFPVPEYDERRHARRAAEFLQADHTELEVTPDAVAILPRLVEHFDEPFADSSAVPTWYVSKLAREHVTVALTGDGGDELFAGYPRYRAVRLGQRVDRLPSPVRAVLATRLWQWLPARERQKSLLRRWKRFTSALRLPPQRRYLEWIAIFNEAGRAELYSDEFLSRLPDSDPAGFVTRAWDRAGTRDPVTAASMTDLVTYLPGDLMTKVDVASMAHGLECRQPFLDHRVVELAAAMPVRWKFRGGRGKRILRRAFGELLPKPIWRRRKMGFGVPLDHWFRNELVEMTNDVLLSRQSRDRGYFRPETVQRLVTEHQRGTFDHSYRLWALLVLELWQRRWVDE